jgi:hypothetical protein
VRLGVAALLQRHGRRKGSGSACYVAMRVRVEASRCRGVEVSRAAASCSKCRCKQTFGRRRQRLLPETNAVTCGRPSAETGRRVLQLHVELELPKVRQ